MILARTPRILIAGEPAAYHVVSRTALDGFPMGDVEKEHFVKLIQRLGAFYFLKILGFCVMGNHFLLLVRMLPDTDFSNEQIKARHRAVYGDDPVLEDGQVPYFREKWSSLSEFMREVKVGFARFFNRRHGRRGYFWRDRFKSVVVENGETLVNCLAYIDLNPVRAGMVERPEDYRWSSIGLGTPLSIRENARSRKFCPSPPLAKGVGGICFSPLAAFL